MKALLFFPILQDIAICKQCQCKQNVISSPKVQKEPEPLLDENPGRQESNRTGFGAYAQYNPPFLSPPPPLSPPPNKCINHNKPTFHRFCMFPIKHWDIWEMYKKAEASFWIGGQTHCIAYRTIANTTTHIV